MLNRRELPRQRGFTLIELIVSIMVLAVILALGAPTFQTFIQNTRLRTTAEALLNGLQLARAEAVRRNTDVRFVLANDLAWSIIAGDEVLQQRSAAEGSDGVTPTPTPTTATTVTFNGMGRVKTNEDNTASLTRIAIQGGTVSRRIDIGTGGLVRICDPEIVTTGDPRKCEG